MDAESVWAFEKATDHARARLSGDLIPATDFSQVLNLLLAHTNACARGASWKRLHIEPSRNEGASVRLLGLARCPIAIMNKINWLLARRVIHVRNNYPVR